MANRFKKEQWNRTKWKGTKRETKTKIPVLVQRDSKGHFVKVVKTIKEKTYPSGVYQVGIYKNKVVMRQRIQKISPEWKKEHKKEIRERISKRQIFRTSYALNDIPFRGEVYYGFRIIAFSHNKEILHKLRPNLKKRLIQWIEKCVGYREDEFWFNYNWGYEAPQISNALITENNSFYLMWQKIYGSVVKEERHRITELF